MTSDPYSDQNSSLNIDSIIESGVHSTVQSRVQVLYCPDNVGPTDYILSVFCFL